MTSKRLLVFVLLAGLLLPSFAAQEKEIKCPRRKAVKVEVVEIKGQEFREFKEFSASCRAEEILMKANLAGKVSDIKVNPGDIVSRGWPVVILGQDQPDAVKQWQAEKARWERILWNREHWKVRSPRAENQARAQIKAAEAKIIEFKQGGRVEMGSTVAGRVKEITVAAGSQIQVDQAVARIANDDRMLAAVSFGSGGGSLFSSGQNIPVRLQKDNSRISATVKEVRGDSAILSIPNGERRIREGDTISFSLLSKLHDQGVVLPKSDIMMHDNRPFVFVVNGKLCRQAFITVGAERDGLVLISDGLTLSDLRIISNLGLLCDGQRIKVTTKGVSVPAGKEAEKVVKPVVVKTQPVRPKEKKTRQKPLTAATNEFSLGVGLGFSLVHSEWYTDIYSRGSINFAVRAAYLIQQKIEVFAEWNMWNTTGKLLATQAETKLTSMPIVVGARYLFNISEKFTPYIGMAGLYYSVTEENEIEKASESALGASILGGTYYKLSDTLNLDFVIRYDLAKFSVEGFPGKPDMSGPRIFLMLTYGF